MLYENYEILNKEEIVSPALIYYKSAIKHNIEKMISIAGSSSCLWTHVKTHKTKEIVAMQMDMGITKFKCATIAETEMVADLEAKEIILSYPLVGPNIKRFVELSKCYERSKIYAIGDDISQIQKLSECAVKNSLKIPFLLDVNMGLDRTGVKMDCLYEMYKRVAQLSGVRICGLHCYDGGRHENDYEERLSAVKHWDDQIFNIKRRLTDEGYRCDFAVLGGTPSFPCHAEQTKSDYFSPGTSILFDAGYEKNFPDLPFYLAAVVMTRVISHPAPGLFTLDLGYKGIASDPKGARGKIVGLKDYEELFQNEEHWVFKMNKGFENDRPYIGEVLYVIPTHICPTSALYQSALVADKHMIIDEWLIAARNRKIKF